MLAVHCNTVTLVADELEGLVSSFDMEIAPALAAPCRL